MIKDSKRDHISAKLEALNTPINRIPTSISNIYGLMVEDISSVKENIILKL